MDRNTCWMRSSLSRCTFTRSLFLRTVWGERLRESRIRKTSCPESSTIVWTNLRVSSNSNIKPLTPQAAKPSAQQPPPARIKRKAIRRLMELLRTCQQSTAVIIRSKTKTNTSPTPRMTTHCALNRDLNQGIWGGPFKFMSLSMTWYWSQITTRRQTISGSTFGWRTRKQGGRIDLI